MITNTKREFLELTAMADSVQLKAILIMVKARSEGLTINRAKELAASYFDTCPGYEAEARSLRSERG